jgi:hypothetical protein
MSAKIIMPLIIIVSLNVICCDNYIDSINWDNPKGYINAEILNTGLPIIKINTNNQKITSTENYITADIQIVDGNDSDNNITTITEIRGRGNATWNNFAKKPYRLKFFEKQGLFGRTKAKSWVLLANSADDTMIRNIIAFEMGQRFGLPYTNHYIPVELVLNGEYRGSYVLTEQVQVGKGRVNIDEDTGYLVEITLRYDEEPKFRTKEILLPIVIKSPETILNSVGDNFVKQSINELVEKMFSRSFPENGYRDLIDMDTFVDYIMIQEFLANTDFWSLGSIYMYKDTWANSKICMGPLWDFDNTLGDPNIRISPNSEKKKRLGEVFWGKFFEDPVFSARYKERWDAHYDIISREMPLFIDAMASKLLQSKKANHELWQGETVDDEYYSKIIDDLKLWWKARVNFMNGEIQ